MASVPLISILFVCFLPVLRPKVRASLVAIVLVMVWLAAAWLLFRANDRAAMLNGPLRQNMEYYSLVAESAQQHWDSLPSPLRWWANPQALRDELRRTYHAAEQEYCASSGVRLEWAIICHRAAQEAEAALWKARGLEALEQVSEGREHIYFIAAHKALLGSALTEQEHRDLAQLCKTAPANWHVVQLARVHGLAGHADEISMAKSADKAFNRWLAYGLLSLLALVLALLLGLLAWREWRRQPVAHRHHYRRFIASWSWQRVCRWVSIIGLGKLALSLLVMFSAGSLLTAWGSKPQDIVQHVYLLCNLGWVALSVAEVVALCLLFAPSVSAARRVLGFASSDLGTARYWLIGIAIGLVMAGLQAAFGMVAIEFSDVLLLDNFRLWQLELGEAEGPVLLFLGCVIAPLAEEVVFRGFLFAGLRQTLGLWPAAVVSSLIFASVHDYSLVGMVGVFLFGLGFALLYQRTGKLAINMVAHGTINALFITLMLLTRP